ncbi:NAD(P)H-hydrate dehydratase [Thioalkalivibrio sp. XN279]|uniref:NAD(P)H-hydrate dehydratase n=1 Tax=Thioalkalivibrio sp. XN279 TaxID=2714953 RepID=UPI00140C6199|nr:NAD(P)H-hydrate dehydratase [Thioalkalivibrio sp. XN279]NHA14781.1 NAD(P)H-hydrate dehydratase [Thioalkalivibrio sp. XN279]
MSAMPRELWTAAQVRELDRRAIETHGIAGRELMERAGRAALDALLQRWPAARDVAVLCGGGNNAGDGYVLARRAMQCGLAARVVGLAAPETLRGDAAAACADYLAAGGVIEPWAGDGPLPGDGPLVDGLLGTGLDRTLEGRYAQVVEAVNADGRPVLALDIPTGLHADTGRILGVAVRATVTVCFIGLKLGLFTGRGRACAGEVLFADLDVPQRLEAGLEPAARRLEPACLGEWLRPRERDAHKGRFGHVLVVGGDHGMGGAALLAGRAALRSGAGLVSVATRPAHAAAMFAAQPELMCRGVEGPRELEPLLERATVLVAGPGLGRSGWAQELLAVALDSGLPCILDADALNLLSEHPRRISRGVLTPHPGEAARLLDSTAAEVEADRPAALRALQSRFGGVVLLKGAGTLVAGAGPVPWLCGAGNPGMASGGMGDVLSGLIGGLAAQLQDLERAACAGVLVHALAADDAAAHGERGLAAGDLLQHVRPWVNPRAAHPPA